MSDASDAAGQMPGPDLPKKGEAGAEPTSESTMSLAARDLVATALLARARNLVLVGYGFATLIFVLLAAGALAFFFADELFVRNISAPVGRLVDAQEKFTNSLKEFKRIDDHIKALRSIQADLDSVKTREIIARDSTAQDDRLLEAMVVNIAKLSQEMEKEEKARDRTYEEERKAVEDLIASGNWKNAPGAPQEFPTEFKEKNELINAWVTGFETPNTQDQYRFMEPIVRIQKQRSLSWDRLRTHETALKRAAGELRKMEKVRLDNWQALKNEVKQLREASIQKMEGVTGAINSSSAAFGKIENNTARFAGDFKRAANDLFAIEKKFDNYAVYTSLVTRISILAILIFLVQILTSMYKYNMRLAASYRAQAESLMLIDRGGVDSFRGIAGILMLGDVDFGAPPTTPIQEISALAKAAMQRTQKSPG